jgi:hypothetical protein
VFVAVLDVGEEGVDRVKRAVTRLTSSLRGREEVVSGDISREGAEEDHLEHHVYCVCEVDTSNVTGVVTLSVRGRGVPCDT